MNETEYTDLVFNVYAPRVLEEEMTDQEQRAMRKALSRPWKMFSDTKCEVIGCNDPVERCVGWTNGFFDQIYFCKNHSDIFIKLSTVRSDLKPRLERNLNTGWVTGVICGRWFLAKVNDTPSTYGVNNGRVSKLSIGKTSIRNKSKYINFLDQMDYHYDRGLDFDNLRDPILLSMILEVLENLE